MNELKVWLAYVAHPITTAVYLERALRRICRVTTIGPHLTEHLIEAGKLQNMKLPVRPHDIDTSLTPDMAGILATTPPEQHPDLYIWVQSTDRHFPYNLEALSCPKVCYLVDNHIGLDAQLQWAKKFDRVFIAQREYLPDFRAQGCNVHWLPLACDTKIHCKTDMPKLYPVSFVGGVSAGSRRETLFVKLGSQIPLYYERCFWDDMARVFSQSKIVLNEAVSNDLNMRVFEALSTGSLLLTDMARNSGQEILFNNGEDYALYRHDEELVEVARFYLENEALREQIATRGQRLVHNAHTYDHRAEDLLAVALGGKPDTFSAEELRERSLVDVPAIDAAIHDAVCISSGRRSFVIPVLDMSPASEYNILTLLKDLEAIEGDVIVIFNGQEVAEQLKDHPRITRYAIMKQNVGVARAWNLGLETAATPTVFILNADLHVQASAVETLERSLWKLPDAACVGPQGCFSDFALTMDYTYFDKGTFGRPIEVDAVSGFFFAMKLEHFNEKKIRFENGFTPCYFEELDLGLQIKRAGLKSYIVPTTAYDHHWSGTIRALRKIRYYEISAPAGEILLRNRMLFLNKWRGITSKENNRHILESGWRHFGLDLVRVLLQADKVSEAVLLAERLRTSFPEDAELAAYTRFATQFAQKATLNQLTP